MRNCSTQIYTYSTKAPVKRERGAILSAWRAVQLSTVATEQSKGIFTSVDSQNSIYF